MSTVAQISMENKTINTFEIDTVTETHEQFLSRRSNQMAGMIGLLTSHLEMAALRLKLDAEYDSMSVAMFRRSANDSRKTILECLIKYQHEWAEMQEYEEGDYGMDMYKRKIAEYTTELEALKSLAL